MLQPVYGYRLAWSAGKSSSLLMRGRSRHFTPNSYGFQALPRPDTRLPARVVHRDCFCRSVSAPRCALFVLSTLTMQCGHDRRPIRVAARCRASPAQRANAACATFSSYASTASREPERRGQSAAPGAARPPYKAHRIIQTRLPNLSRVMLSFNDKGMATTDRGVMLDLRGFSTIFWRHEMKIKKLIVAGIIFGAVGNTASAQVNIINDWYVAPLVSFTVNSSHRAKDYGVAGAGALGKVLSEKWNIELSGQYVDFGAHDNQASIGIDALYFIERNKKFSPFITLGLGGVDEGSMPNNDKNQRLMLRGGVGFTVNVIRNVDFRMDAKYQWHGSTAGAPNLGDFFITSGLYIYF